MLLRDSSNLDHAKLKQPAENTKALLQALHRARDQQVAYQQTFPQAVVLVNLFVVPRCCSLKLSTAPRIRYGSRFAVNPNASAFPVSTILALQDGHAPILPWNAPAIDIVIQFIG